MYWSKNMQWSRTGTINPHAIVKKERGKKKTRNGKITHQTSFSTKNSHKKMCINIICFVLFFT